MRGWERCSQSLGRGGERGSFVAWLEEGGKSLSLSLPTYRAALKGVMEAVRGGYIIIIIIITRSDKHGFSSSTDGRTIHNSQKAFSFSFDKTIPRSREEILKSSQSSNRKRKRRETGLLD